MTTQRSRSGYFDSYNIAIALCQLRWVKCNPKSTNTDNNVPKSMNLELGHWSLKSQDIIYIILDSELMFSNCKHSTDYGSDLMNDKYKLRDTSELILQVKIEKL